MLKVLIIISGGLFREGITSTQLDFMRSIDKSDMEFSIVAMPANEQEILTEFTNLGCKVVLFPDRRKETIDYMLALFNQIKREKYDIVHVHGSSALMSIELFIAKIAGVKVRIVHSRNTKSDHSKIDKFLRPIFYRLYTHAFACGQEAGEWLFENRNFTIIHNGKDLEKFSFNNEMRTQIRHKFRWENSIVIGHVGNFNYQKNHEFLLEIFRDLVVKNHQYVLCLMGDGPEKGSIESIAKMYGIDDKVIFMGRINNVNEMLQAMDLMLLPSRFEGLPNVVLEWQASGLPCIVSDTVTKECAVTPIVQFLSISDYSVWVEKISNYQFSDRASQKDYYKIKLAGAGFDLSENAKDLRALYFSLVSSQSNGSKSID